MAALVRDDLMDGVVVGADVRPEPVRCHRHGANDITIRFHRHLDDPKQRGVGDRPRLDHGVTFLPLF